MFTNTPLLVNAQDDTKNTLTKTKKKRLDAAALSGGVIAALVTIGIVILAVHIIGFISAMKCDNKGLLVGIAVCFFIFPPAGFVLGCMAIDQKRKGCRPMMGGMYR